MGLKTYKPITPPQRYYQSQTWDELTKKSPEKQLTKGKKRISARSSTTGRITIRRRGGGHKRKYRIIDFKRNKPGVPARVAAIEYDPNRSANIALLHYYDGEKRYILAPRGVTVGAVLTSGNDAPLQPGNHLPLDKIALGSVLHNIELNPGAGGQLVRAAGTAATLLARSGKYVTIRLPSGEMRMILGQCSATLGSLSNEDHMNTSLGKAGRARWLGRRPKVRGVAMNPVDHPHGGGEGKTSGGRHPVSPWGVPTKGYKTRKKRKSNRLVVKKRK